MGSVPSAVADGSLISVGDAKDSGVGGLTHPLPRTVLTPPKYEFGFQGK